jgi:hypothetical protein
VTDRYGSLLYPKAFVESLPKPDAHDTRPLVMLLRGTHRDPEPEIERIERWFRELDGPDPRKSTLVGNLRSTKPRHFWSALYELMTSRVFAERGCRAQFEIPVRALTPDFVVRCHTGVEFVAEVMTAFEEEEYRRTDDDLHYVATALAEIQHRIAVFLDEVDLPANRPSMKPLLARVRTWLDRCNPDVPEKITFTPDEVGLSATLTTVGSRAEADSIVDGIVGPGGKISTHETIRRALERKSSKYRIVKG